MTPSIQVALFGECMIELQGEAFGTMRQTFGGDTLNTAVYLARSGASLGVHASYATGLGDDRYSDEMLRRWQLEGVATDLVRRLPGRVPGLYTISVDERGERTFTYWRDSSAARGYFDVPETPLEQAAGGLDALYFSGISLAILDLGARERLFETARRVRAHGGRVIFDNNYRPRLWADAPTARAAYAQALALSDVALVTLDDEQLLYGDASLAESRDRSLAAPCEEVVIKQGGGPVIVRCASSAIVEVPVRRVERVVDTTAAGDSFAGAYLAARLSGASAVDAAAAGARLAAQVIQHRGAIVAPELLLA
ncbi:MAG: sugar kinase [Burkholderiales bacterium]